MNDCTVIRKKRIRLAPPPADGCHDCISNILSFVSDHMFATRLVCRTWSSASVFGVSVRSSASGEDDEHDAIFEQWHRPACDMALPFRACIHYRCPTSLLARSVPMFGRLVTLSLRCCSGAFPGENIRFPRSLCNLDVSCYPYKDDWEVGDMTRLLQRSGICGLRRLNANNRRSSFVANVQLGGYEGSLEELRIKNVDHDSVLWSWSHLHK